MNDVQNTDDNYWKIIQKRRSGPNSPSAAFMDVGIKIQQHPKKEKLILIRIKNEILHRIHFLESEKGYLSYINPNGSKIKIKSCTKIQNSYRRTMNKCTSVFTISIYNIPNLDLDMYSPHKSTAANYVIEGDSIIIDLHTKTES